jgi:hypothetical protein
MPRGKGASGETRGKLPGHDSEAGAPALDDGARGESASPQKRFASTKVEIEGREES